MAKRSRLSSRPGQRRPTIRRRPTTALQPVEPGPVADEAPPAAVRGGLTDEEEARAAEIETRLVAQEKAATAASRRASERTRRGATESSLPLSVRAAAEYAYVQRDVTRILRITALLVAILLALHLLINVFGVITIF
jgi:hypothetical protein